MRNTYFDNAATTFPKPAAVACAVYEYMTKVGCNINRGCYGSAYDIEEKVFETRELLCDLFGGEDCRQVIFTSGVTESLNVVLKGLLRPNDHVLVSSMEHNAVMRPLLQLEKAGVSFTRIPCSMDGEVLYDSIEDLIQEHTKAVAICHASNVSGTIQDLERIGRLAKNHGLYFIVDAAQTAGVIPIDLKRMQIDALCFTGHKGLLGPQGTGGFLLAKGMEQRIEPLISGGTGSISHLEEIPSFMPDRFEAGTRNLPGILGLYEALKWMRDTSITEIYRHEMELTKYFLSQIGTLEEKGLLRIVGKRDCENRTGVVSVQTTGMDQAEAAQRLDQEYQIQIRVGLHCAPSAHKTLGTYPEGTIRFSFGWYHTKEDVAYAIHALEEICHGI